MVPRWGSILPIRENLHVNHFWDLRVEVVDSGIILLTFLLTLEEPFNLNPSFSWARCKLYGKRSIPKRNRKITMLSFMPLTGEEGTNADGGSVDSSVSSGDEVPVAHDSSPAPSPKRFLENVQGVTKVNS